MIFSVPNPEKIWHQ